MVGARTRSSNGSGGAELFKELFRQYSLAKVDDYFKDGRWLIRELEVDTELLIVHRREAGAEEPPPLEELDLPELPREREGRPGPSPPGAPPPRMRSAPPRTPPLSLASSEKGRALAPSGVASARPRTPPRGAPPPRRPTSASDDRPVRRLAPAAPPTAKERLDSFIGRWRLDSRRTKLLMVKLTPEKQREVFQTFTWHTSGDPDVGLERYVEKYTRNGSSTSSAKRSVNGSVGSSETSAAKRPRADPGSSDPPPIRRTAVGARPSSSSMPSKPKAPPPRSSQRNGEAKEGRSSAAVPSMSSSEPGDLIRSLLGTK